MKSHSFRLGCFKSAKNFICQKVQHFQADSELILKEKIQFFFQCLALPMDPQSPYHTTYISLGEFRPSTKKVCSSDVKHCLINIFELKMMLKIGVIFKSFSNPTSEIISEIQLTLPAYRLFSIIFSQIFRVCMKMLHFLTYEIFCTFEAP